MASKLRKKTARVSFFAFQDMITTVTGVLMIVMLMLSIDVTRIASTPSEAARSNLRKELEEARARLDASAQELQQRQSELLSLTNRVFVLHERDRSGKQPVLVVLSATNGYCARPGQTNRTEFRIRNGKPDFRPIAAECNASRDRLVFYVRPSGIEGFKECRKWARNGGYTIGYDVALEDRQYDLLSQ